MSIPFISAEEAASYVNNGDNVALSGFTASGTPKLVPKAIAERARSFHAKGEPFKINLYTGASTNEFVDGELTTANAIGKRAPYQGTKVTRESLNRGDIDFYDPHLSHMSQDIRYGFIGDIDVAIVEVTEMNPSGEVILGAGLGMTPTIVQLAKKVIIEYCSYYRTSFRGFHDNYVPLDPPHRREIPIYKPSDRIGSTVLQPSWPQRCAPKEYGRSSCRYRAEWATWLTLPYTVLMRTTTYQDSRCLRRWCRMP